MKKDKKPVVEKVPTPKKKSTAKRQPKQGRTSIMTDEMSLKFFTMIAQGLSVEAICRIDGMPCDWTIYNHIRNDPKFEQAYKNAREIQAERFLDEIIQIADDGKSDYYEDSEGNVLVDHDHIARSRLRVDTRKWAMARMSPRKYSERVVNEIVGKDGGAVDIKQTLTLADFYGQFGTQPAKPTDT